MYVQQGIVMNGVYSAIPYFFLTVTVLSAGQLADFLRARWLSTVAVRKGFTAISECFVLPFMCVCVCVCVCEREIE